MPATRSRRFPILALTVFAVAEMVSVGHGSPAAAGQPKKKTTKHAAVAKPASKDFEASFQTFCQGWMEKIRARELGIKWETDADSSVHRKYVEYAAEYTCTLTTGNPPIGKVNYREVWYEKRGKTIAEAEASTARPVQVFETSELFSYAKGKWTYQ